MHVHALKLSITEQELNEWAAALPAGKSSIEDLQIRLTAEGIVVRGEYPTLLMKMAFETLWEVKGVGSIVEARLISMKVAGLPATMLRGVVLKTLSDLLGREPSVRVVEQSLYIDLSKLAVLQKLPLCIHLTTVECSPGKLVIEAGPALG
jgi:hypothetical protein